MISSLPLIKHLNNLPPMLAWIKGARLPANSFLDVGCYNGAILNIIEHYFPDADLYGVDIDDDALATCQKQQDCAHMDMHSLTFEDGSYDWVICASVLRYAANRTPFHHVTRIPRYGIILNECTTRMDGKTIPLDLDSRGWMSMFPTMTPMYLLHTNYHTFWAILLHDHILADRKRLEIHEHSTAQCFHPENAPTYDPRS